ncbi:hypothetical protein F0160_10345 [Paraburkholderia sp. JPY303]|nr:hypothetical protein [Paraburkholderia atlantica]
MGAACFVNHFALAPAYVRDPPSDRRSHRGVEQIGVRAWVKVAHCLLLIGSKEENGLARSSSPAMLRGKQIETRSVQLVDDSAHCLSWI